MFWAVEAPHHAEMRRKQPDIEPGQHLYGRTQGHVPIWEDLKK